MDPVNDLLGLTADYASQFLGSLDERPVRAEASVEELRDRARRPAAGARHRARRRSSPS